MRNQINLAQDPEQVFLNPWGDEGLTLVSQPPYIWRPTKGAMIEGASVGSDPSLNDKIEGFLTQTRRHRKFKQPIIYASVAAVLEKVGFRKSFVLANDRIVLGGAPGMRAINRYRWSNEAAEIDPQRRLMTYFATKLAENRGKALPVDPDAITPDMDFAITARNTFNFYHFVTETLCQLCVLDDLDFQGRVFIHFPNSTDKTRDFVHSFVDVLFPEYRGRVFFERAPKDYDRVLTAVELSGLHCLNPDLETENLSALAPSAQIWQGQAATAASQGMLSQNAISSNLLALRDRALRATRGMDFSDLPKKFYVGRDSRQSRVRHLEGEDLLFDHLRLFGFEYVVFENMHPLEQVALMANAEIMVSYHGAGFTNMLFANPDAWVIEIGTLQTAMTRWGDFWPVAHAAECNYVSFFADYKDAKAGADLNPCKEDLLPASLSREGIGQVMAFVVALDGHVPEMPKADDLLHLAQILFRVNQVDKALRLLESHPKLTAYNLALQLLLADCYKQVDLPKSELMALDHAFKADPTRWQTLIRIIWCANRCKRPQVIRWAMARLRSDFPARHDAFLENHAWVRYVV